MAGTETLGIVISRAARKRVRARERTMSVVWTWVWVGRGDGGSEVMEGGWCV